MSVAAAEQVVIAGGTNVGVASGGRVVINNWRKASLPQQSSAAYDRAKRSLEKHVVSDAIYDSEVNISAGSCHPGTRVAALATLKQRVTSDDPDAKGVCWLNGPAGAGKSAIVRSLGEQLDDEDLLGGSFFFFRTDARRNSPDEFMATITYQLCVALPKLRPYVEQAIEKEPLVFERSPKRQLKSLILQPAAKAMAHGALQEDERRVILVDGLDECGEKEQQEELVNVLFELAEKFPLKLTILVASRPERHLRAVFEEEPMQSSCSVVTLNDDFEPDVDIRKFLVDKFNEILRKHPLRAQLRKLIVKWPTPEAIDQLISRASGQFIYASTVIKFVSSFRANPAERLEMVLGERDPGNLEPFEQLDALYTTILRAAPTDDIAEIVDMLAILAVILSNWSLTDIPLRPELAEMLMGYPTGYIKLLLVDLESVVKLPDDAESPIQFYHKSFSEYLFDARRALGFSRSSRKVYSRLMAVCVQFEIQHWDGDIPASMQATPEDHSDKVLTIFSRQVARYNVSSSENTEEMADLLRQYLDRHVVASRTGPGQSGALGALPTVLVIAFSLSEWILQFPQPFPPYAVALWGHYKECVRKIFEQSVGPSADPLACAAMWCAPAWAISDIPASTSCLDEVEWARKASNHGSAWQTQPGDSDHHHRLDILIGVSAPGSNQSALCCHARIMPTVIYTPVTKQSILAFCVAVLKSPKVVSRSVLETHISDITLSMSCAQLAQRCLINLLKIAPTDNDELNALKAAGNPFPLDLGYEHGFDEVLRGEDVPPRPESPQVEPMEAGEEGGGAGEAGGIDKEPESSPEDSTTVARPEMPITNLELSEEPDALPE